MTMDEARQRRILTPIFGSPPRPDALSEMMAEGKTAPAIFAKAVREAVSDVVRRQVDWGVDIVDDGELPRRGFISYTDARLAGREPRHDDPPQLDSREKQAFPEFYAHGHSGTRPPPRLCTGPVLYTGQRQLQTDIENLKAALNGVAVTDVFMPAVSPGQIFRYHVNRHYKSHDGFLDCLGDC